MIRTIVLYLLLCIPILSGCQCIKHNNYEQKKLEQTKPTSCCTQDKSATSYIGVLRSVDCPENLLHHQLVNHNKHLF